MHTVEAFHRADANTGIVLVLPKDHIQYWESLCSEYQFQIPHRVVVGGKERFHSVKNALDTLSDADSLIAIHDGARPLVSAELINRLFRELQSHNCVVPVVTPKESIRKIEGDHSVAVDRNHFVMVQTPQCFAAGILKSAYEVEYQPSFTDDASVLEYSGHQIHLVEGAYSNIKITSPEDLKIAEALI